MPSFTTRAARLDDAEELAAVHTQSWQETYTGLFSENAWSAESRVRREAMWNVLLTDDDTTSVVAEVDGAIIGFAHAEHNRPRARTFYAKNRFMRDGTVREMDFNPNIRELRLIRR